jgi:hypothetical protein
MSKKVYRIEEKLVLALFLFIGIFGTFMGIKMGNPLNQSVGPSIFPILLSLVIVSCVMIEIYMVFLRPNPKGSDTEISLQMIKDLALMGVVLFVSVGIWILVGYVPAIICALLSVVMYGHKDRLIRGLMYAAGVALVMWGLFFKILGLS